MFTKFCLNTDVSAGLFKFVKRRRYFMRIVKMQSYRVTDASCDSKLLNGLFILESFQSTS